MLLDRDRSVARAWDVHALPTTVILDRALVPRLTIAGDLDWQRPDVVARIATLAATFNPTTNTDTGG